MRRLAFLFVLLTVFHTVPAHAALDPKGIKTLHDIFVRYIEDKKAMMKAGRNELRTEGEVMVEAGDYYYAVTLPHISIHRPDGSYSDIGIIAINAMPGEKPKEWKMTVAIPTPLTTYDKDKNRDTVVNIGTQTLNGVWHEDMGNFSRINARYESITINGLNDGTTTIIPKASVVYELTPSANNKAWSGPVKYAMENIQMTRASDQGVSKIGKIDVDFFVSDYAPHEMAAYKEKIQSLSENTSPLSTSGQHIQGVYNLLFDFMGSVWEGFDAVITVQDATLSRPAMPGIAPGTIAFQRATLGFDAKGFRSNGVTTGMKASYNGLSITPPPAGFEEATPTQLTMDVGFGNVPFRDLVELGRNALESATTRTPTEASPVMLILQALSKASTNMKVTKSSFGNSTYNMYLDGNMIANLKTPLGVTGRARMEIIGLEKLIRITQAKLQEDNLPPVQRSMIQKTMITLGILQMVGKETKNAEGQPVRGYDIVMGEDGKVMLNGMDLSVLQSMAGAEKAKP